VPIHPWTRRSTAALLLLATLCAASLAGLTHPWFEATNETYDASIYLACAKSLLAGEGYSVLGMPFNVRPPGFSLVLAPVLAARGLDFLALNLLVGAFGVAAVLGLFVLARERQGDLPAFCVALALFLNPGFRHLSNQVMSDVPGLALTLLGLVLARWAERAPSARRDLGLGLGIGLGAHLRTAVVLVVPAVLLARALARGRSAQATSFLRFARQRMLVLPVATLAVLVPWSFRNALHHPPWPAEQTLLASYSTGMWHVDGGDPDSPWIAPGDLFSRARVQAPRILADLGGRLDPQAAGALPTVLGAAMLAAIAWVALRRREPLEMFALVSFGVLAVYFAHDWRLALPVFAVGLVSVAEVLAAAVARFAGLKAGSAAAAAGALALLALDFAPRRGWEEIRAAHEVDLATADALRAELAPEARLAAPVGWHWSVLLDRPVYSLYFAGKRGGGNGVLRVIDERGIDAVIVRTEPEEARRTLELLELRYGKSQALGPVAVVRTKR